jgi:Predicted membrane protein
MVYELKFDTADANYEYEVDALSGMIRSYDRDVRYQSSAPQETTVPETASSAPQAPPLPAPTRIPAPTDTATTSYIGEAKAESIALTHAGLKESDVTFIKNHQDWDNGRAVYDVEFYSGNIEYDYEIDAITGEIREYGRDIENYSIATSPATPTFLLKSTLRAVSHAHQRHTLQRLVTINVEQEWRLSLSWRKKKKPARLNRWSMLGLSFRRGFHL